MQSVMTANSPWHDIVNGDYQKGQLLLIVCNNIPYAVAVRNISQNS